MCGRSAQGARERVRVSVERDARGVVRRGVRRARLRAARAVAARSTVLRWRAGRTADAAPAAHGPQG